MAYFVAFFISFQKIIPSKIPPGGTGVLGGSRTKMAGICLQSRNHLSYMLTTRNQKDEYAGALRHVLISNLAAITPFPNFESMVKAVSKDVY